MPAAKTKTVFFLAVILAAWSLPLAAHTRTAENSPLGLGASVTGGYRAAPDGNLQNALGSEAELRQTRVRSRCTAKLRDYESGLNLDYFGARYYTGAMGRFTSADPLTGWPSDPQSWNMYAYGRNNPLLYTDPTGTNDVICDANGENCADLTDDQYKEYRESEPNISQDAGGTLSVTNEDGSATEIGSARYYDEKPFEILRDVGDRSARHTNTFMISSAVFATAYISTYAVPVVIAGLTAMGEIGAVGPGVGLLKAAKRFKLPKTHPAIANLKLTVDQYISNFRKAGVRAQMPGEFMQKTVEEALASGNTTVRKLLVDGRWAK